MGLIVTAINLLWLGAKWFIAPYSDEKNPLKKQTVSLPNYWVK